MCCGDVSTCGGASDEAGPVVDATPAAAQGVSGVLCCCVLCRQAAMLDDWKSSDIQTDKVFREMANYQLGPFLQVSGKHGSMLCSSAYPTVVPLSGWSVQPTHHLKLSAISMPRQRPAVGSIWFGCSSNRLVRLQQQLSTTPACPLLSCPAPAFLPAL